MEAIFSTKLISKLPKATTRQFGGTLAFDTPFGVVTVAFGGVVEGSGAAVVVLLPVALHNAASIATRIEITITCFSIAMILSSENLTAQFHCCSSLINPENNATPL